MSERGIERSELANGTGFSLTAVNSWYSGDRTPNAESIREICKVVGVSADYLLGLKETMI